MVVIAFVAWMFCCRYFLVSPRSVRVQAASGAWASIGNAMACWCCFARRCNGPAAGSLLSSCQWGMRRGIRSWAVLRHRRNECNDGGHRCCRCCRCRCCCFLQWRHRNKTQTNKVKQTKSNKQSQTTNNNSSIQREATNKQTHQTRTVTLYSTWHRQIHLADFFCRLAHNHRVV